MQDNNRKIADIMKALYGDNYTDDDLQRILKKFNALNITKYAELETLLMILDYNVGIIDRVPDKLKEATNNVINEVKLIAVENAKTEISRLSAEAEQNLSYAVKEATIKSSRSNGWRIHIKSIAISICITILFLIGGTYWFYNYVFEKGKEEGIEIGIAKTRDDEIWLKKWDNFSKTDEFQDAYKMYAKGDLRKIIKLYDNGYLKKFINCSSEDWTENNGFCWGYSYDKDGKVRGEGWKIP